MVRALRARPALVGAAVAGPEDDGGAVGGGGAVDVKAQGGEADAADRAVAVERPLLVVGAVAVPDLDPDSVGGAERRVQALAQNLQRLPALGELLVGAVVAIPDQQLRAVGRAAVVDVQATS